MTATTNLDYFEVNSIVIYYKHYGLYESCSFKTSHFYKKITSNNMTLNKNGLTIHYNDYKDFDKLIQTTKEY